MIYLITGTPGTGKTSYFVKMWLDNTDGLFKFDDGTPRPLYFCHVDGLDKKRLKAHELSHISTHSRAKAAGKPSWRNRSVICYFNSQPREGGWHTPYVNQAGYFYISTHSRAKAAGRS